MSRTGPPTERTKLRRLRERGSHDRSVIAAILDEGLICHVGFAVDGRPWVVPMLHARCDDQLYLHGAVGNHLLRWLNHGTEACVTVTLLDGLVFARSAFHHSVNYRSVMVFGTARLVSAPDQKAAALDAIVEHVMPGRSRDSRRGSAQELAQTRVVVLPLDEASAKVRTGGPSDEPEDLDLPYWAGVLPVALSAGTPVPGDELASDIPVPDYLHPPSRPGLKPAT